MNNNDGNTVISSLIWKFAERLLAQGISFVVSIVLARKLMPSEYGSVSLVLIFIIFADVFVTSGFSTALIQKKDADEIDFSTIFYCSFLVSVVIYIFLFLVAPWIATFYEMPVLAPVLRVFALRLPLSAFNATQHAYVSRHMLFRKFFFSTLFGTILSGFVGIFMAYSNFGVWALVGQYLSNTIVDSIILSFTISWRPRLLFSMRSARLLMNYGWKVLAADLSGAFFEQLRSLIIGKFYTPDDLAYYNRGKSFSSLVTDNISTSIMSVLFPAMSDKSDNPMGIKEMLRRAIRVMTFIIFPIIGGLVVVAEPLIDVLLTSKWKSSIPFLRILCISSAIGLVGNISLQAIKALGRSDIVLKLELIKKPVYIILLILGVKHSVIAVAATMLIYSLYSAYANISPLKKLIGYSYIEQLSDLSAASIMTLVMVTIISFWGVTDITGVPLLFLQMATGMIVYFAFAYFIKPDAYRYVMGYVTRMKGDCRGRREGEKPIRRD